ncbi:hypothetical protein GCM10010433_54930 [Streptomyces pulveraceus]
MGALPTGGGVKARDDEQRVDDEFDDPQGRDEGAYRRLGEPDPCLPLSEGADQLPFIGEGDGGTYTERRTEETGAAARGPRPDRNEQGPGPVRLKGAGVFLKGVGVLGTRVVVHGTPRGDGAGRVAHRHGPPGVRGMARRYAAPPGRTSPLAAS